jgi:hypothetical protein
MSLKKILILGVVPFLLGCATPQFVKDGAKKYRDSKKNTFQARNELIKSKIPLSKEEFSCLLENEGYYAKAYCHNKINTIKFYSDFKQIEHSYKIIHTRKVGTHLGDRYLLPSGEIAHLKIWIKRK